jgi:hypothetical protein
MWMQQVSGRIRYENLPDKLIETAELNLLRCNRALDRMRKGVSLLLNNDDAWAAFQLANRVMDEQSKLITREHISLNRLKGKTALITGTARPRGVGNSFARVFAQEGAQVALTDMDDHLWDCVKALQDAGL